MKKYLIIAIMALCAPHLKADLTGLAKKIQETAAKAQTADIPTLLKEGKEIFGQLAPIIAKAKVYPHTTKMSFELKNKSGKDVYLALKTAGELYKEGDEVILVVPAGKYKQAPLDITKDTDILLWKTKPVVSDQGEFTPEAEMRYKVKPLKTIYVTYDGKETADGKMLREQTGPAKGALGKTDTGLSKKNNVKNKEIEKIS